MAQTVGTLYMSDALAQNRVKMNQCMTSQEIIHLNVARKQRSKLNCAHVVGTSVPLAVVVCMHMTEFSTKISSAHKEKCAAAAAAVSARLNDVNNNQKKKKKNQICNPAQMQNAYDYNYSEHLDKKKKKLNSFP